jgi:hypothetical protein
MKKLLRKRGTLDLLKKLAEELDEARQLRRKGEIE